MSLQQGVVESYDFDRMIVHFTMLDRDKVVLCAITTAAMDELEGSRNVGSDQRVDQFMRLRAKIEERARVNSMSRARSINRSCCDRMISSNSLAIQMNGA